MHTDKAVDSNRNAIFREEGDRQSFLRKGPAETAKPAEGGILIRVSRVSS
jgi:hypothetical protein